MKKRISFALLAIILCFAVMLPVLSGCADEPGGGEVVQDTQENVETSAQPVGGEVTETETQEEEAPKSDYIPPENYVDFSNSESLNSTQNIGGGGTRVETGGNTTASEFSISQMLAANPVLGGTAAGRRDIAEAAMRGMLSLLWTPAEDTVYSYNAGAYESATAVDEDAFLQNRITLEKGKVYQGLPYTLGSAGVAAFTYGATAQNGIYTVSLTKEILSGSSAVSARLGVDDSDALYWAWAASCNDLFFKSGSEMVEANGVLPVGDYKLTENVKNGGSLAGETDDVVTLNGQQKMYAAYAAMQKADGLVADTDNGGHVMMAVSVSVVTDPDGSINGNQSVVTVLEQTDANLVTYENLSPDEKAAKKNETLVIGGIDVKYTFAELFAAGYIPVTCEDLNKDGALEGVWVGDSIRQAAGFTKKALFSDYMAASDEPNFVTSNRRIVYLHQVVTDKDGKVMIDTTAFPTENSFNEEFFLFELKIWDDAAEADRCIGEASTSTLKSKETYHCSLTGLLATGETVTFRDFEFEF